MRGLIDLVARVEARHKGKEGNIKPKSGRYRLVPADADDLARRIVTLLNQAESGQ